jgi:hypothetical protein
MSRNARFALLCAGASFLLSGFTNSALALMTETFGNRPLDEPAYQEWPNLAAVINATNRIYQRWGNGGESFYFRGGNEALNHALKRFALVKANTHEVALLPGPAVVSSLIPKKDFNYDWRLEFTAGVSKFMTEGEGGLIWNPAPMLTVFIGGGNLELDKLRIPSGITVLELGDLRKRYAQAIRESPKQEVRGWGACELARLDPYSAESLSVVTNLLRDTNGWVRGNAAFALALFGLNAAPALPLLRQMAQTQDKDLKQDSERAIAAIEGAGESASTDTSRTNVLERIHLFRQRVEQAK